MHELLTYTDSDFTDLASLMQELSSSIVFTRESLDRMLADPNSHLYIIREEGRIVACACLCIYHQPFSTDATIESLVVSSKMRGKGLGLYQRMGFEKNETNCYVMKVEGLELRVKDC